MNLRVICAYCAFGLVAFCAALLWQLPASLVPRLLYASPQGQSFQLDSVEGSFWQGTAHLSIDGIHLGSLDWRVPPLPLLGLSPRIDWHLEGSNLSGRITVTQASTITDLEGSLDLVRIAPVLSRYAVHMEGHLRFDDFRLETRAQTASLAGQIEWSGGDVRVRIGDWQERQALPTMRATATEASRMVVTLRDDQTHTHVLAGEIRLLGDGWVKLGATGHLTRRFNPSLATGADPDAILVSVEERIL